MKVNKRGPKPRPGKRVAIRALIPTQLNDRLDVLAAQELRPKASMIHVLLREALDHRSKSRG